MNSDDQRDQLLDMLLREVVGGESPTDIRDRVLKAVKAPVNKPRLLTPPRSRPVALPSARPTRTPIFAIAAILMLTAVFLGVMHFQGIDKARTPSITSISGSVNRSAGPLHGGDTIKTGTDSTAIITYPDGTLVELDPESSVLIPKLSLTDRSKTLEIVKGGIHASVAHQGTDYPMTLSTEHAQAVVVGTKLSLSTTDKQTRLEVTEGVVRMEPKSRNEPITVNAGEFAEADHSQFARSGVIKSPNTPTITGFTLMNADTDQPISNTPLVPGQTISLSNLPTKRISLRADVSGANPFNVLFAAIRTDGKNTGLPKLIPQHHAPFFLTGDFSENKRPADCRPWIPKPGTYRISAIPTLRINDTKEASESYTLELSFTP